MIYQVLARKWRPHDFSEMVGQEHVVKALSNALNTDRLHHAYLLTGTRGVGKTTIARILAKSLNCEQGVTATPCGQCSSCHEIDEARFVDLIEVDAASRTKVEDTRELLDNVQYAPTRGRYKVYLIDEVHMLTKHSFNALLKTLEEPPPHVKFLLATTDPQQLPPTVLSRCLQFHLKSLPVAQIQSHLIYIMGQEGIDADAEALLELAHAANGSMRDALSLLDQAIAFSGGKVNTADVRSMLGTIDRSHVFYLLSALANNDAPTLLRQAAELAEQAPDYRAVIKDMLSVLQWIATLQLVPDALNDEVGGREHIERLAQQIAPEDVQLYYQIALLGQKDIELAPDPRGGFDMLMLRMYAFRPQTEHKTTDPISVKPGTTVAASVAAAPRTSVPVSTVPIPVQKDTGLQLKPAELTQDNWIEFVKGLKISGLTRELAVNSVFDRLEGQLIHLCLDEDHIQLGNPRAEERLQTALRQCLGNDEIKLIIHTNMLDRETPAKQRSRSDDERLQAARDSIQQDPQVNAMQDIFQAEVVESSVRSLLPEG